MSFKLTELFLKNYVNKNPVWGPLGYITYKRTYARELDNGQTEEYWQTLKRVVEGTYSIQKEHCERLSLPWDAFKAQKSAQKMYKLMWEFKFLPPGRGLWMMGTKYVKDRGSAALNNCAFVSTKDIDRDFSAPFIFLMDMSMLGVGVGSDIRGAGKIQIYVPRYSNDPFVVDDSREGWCLLLQTILDSYVGKGFLPVNIDFSKVRPAGQKLKGFGGVSGGSKPLEDLVKDIEKVLLPIAHDGGRITSTAIVDLLNYIGKAVVSGNVRRCIPYYYEVLTTKGYKKISELTINDTIKIADKEEKKIINVVNNGVKELLKIKTFNGTVYETTDNHMLLVYDSFFGVFVWKQTLELQPGRDFLVKKRNV